MKYADSFDENVDLVGLGLANVAAGLTGTFVVNGSPTKTEMVDSAGGRTQIAQLTAAAIVVVVLLFLTGPLAYMPNAVLASVVFLIGLRLIDYTGMADIYRLRKGEFAVAAVTAAVVVVVGVEQGIILAMALSIVEHIYHSYRPYDTLLVGRATAPSRPRRSSRRQQSAPGLAVYRFGASLYYANAARFTEEIMEHRRGRRSAAPLVRARRLGDRRHRLLGGRLDPPGPGGARAQGRHVRHRRPQPERRRPARCLRPDREDRHRAHLRLAPRGHRRVSAASNRPAAAPATG